MKEFVALSLLFAAAACGGVTDQPANNTADASIEAVPPDESMPADPVTDNASNSAATTSAAFPAAFEGRWGLVANDCIEGASDAKGLMQVEGATLRFYESQGTAETLTVASPTKVSGEFAFTGEGQRWTKAVRLSLEDGGKVLVRSETEPPSDLRYKKCEG